MKPPITKIVKTNSIYKNDMDISMNTDGTGGVFKSPMKKKGPCWSEYEMIGMKKKGGKKVPNCVPKNKKK